MLDTHKLHHNCIVQSFLLTRSGDPLHSGTCNCFSKRHVRQGSVEPIIIVQACAAEAYRQSSLLSQRALVLSDDKASPAS